MFSSAKNETTVATTSAEFITQNGNGERSTQAPNNLVGNNGSNKNNVVEQRKCRTVNNQPQQTQRQRNEGKRRTIQPNQRNVGEQSTVNERQVTRKRSNG